MNPGRQALPLFAYFAALAVLIVVTAIAAVSFLFAAGVGDWQDILVAGLGVVAVVAGLVAAYRRAVRPIESLGRGIRASRKAGRPASVPVTGPREVADLASDINELLDMLSRQLSERAAAQERYARLFEGSPIPTVVTDVEGRFIDVNPAALAIYGYTREEFLSIAGPDLFKPVDDAEHNELRSVRSRLEHDPDGPNFVHFGPVTTKKKDGSLVRALGTSYRVVLDGSPVWIGILEDVTVREKLERQIKQTERLEAIGQLAGGIAHDFNNLLSVILNATAALKAEAPTGSASTARDFDRIDKAANSAARLTRQLLAFARREAVAAEPVDVCDQIAELAELLRRTLGSHIVLSANLPEDVWPVRIAPGQLEQIVINLAVNARDAMGKGGRLTISAENLEADDAFASGKPAMRPGRYVRLDVSDTGIGMDRETLDRLFEPFFTTKPVEQGTGLGLATVYGIVKQLDGDISAHSEVGVGTTFTILLPAAGGAAKTRAEPEATSQPRARAGATVLVVEDYADLRDLFDEILTAAGYRVITAPDGAAGLDAARAHAGELDVLLTDIVMPHMLGSDLARQLRLEYPTLRVIFMSGHAQPAAGGAVALEPGTPLLQKPFMEAELLQKLDEVLGADRPLDDQAAV